MVRKRLKWRPQYAFAAGFRRMVLWVVDHAELRGRHFAPAAVTDGLAATFRGLVPRSRQFS